MARTVYIPKCNVSGADQIFITPLTLLSVSGFNIVKILSIKKFRTECDISVVEYQCCGY